jgi:hypothetical protein
MDANVKTEAEMKAWRKKTTDWDPSGEEGGCSRSVVAEVREAAAEAIGALAGRYGVRHSSTVPPTAEETDPGRW